MLKVGTKVKYFQFDARTCTQKLYKGYILELKPNQKLATVRRGRVLSTIAVSELIEI